MSLSLILNEAEMEPRLFFHRLFLLKTINKCFFTKITYNKTINKLKLDLKTSFNIVRIIIMENSNELTYRNNEVSDAVDLLCCK